MRAVLSMVYVVDRHMLGKKLRGLLVATVLAVVVACMWYATGGRPPTVARHCPGRECLVGACVLSQFTMYACAHVLVVFYLSIALSPCI